MVDDYFASSIISLILSWAFCLPVLIGVLVIAVQAVVEREPGVPTAFWIWALFSVVVFSPLRYLLFQFLAATAFPFQSLSAFAAVFVLGLYIPIVFFLMCGIGLVVPMILSFLVAGFQAPYRNGRLIMSALAMPFIFFAFNFIFHALLPLAAYSTHWLRAEDVIRCTNGPAHIYYKYAGQFLNPLLMPGFTEEIGLENMSTKEVMRAHVATVYLSNRQFARYLKHAYPRYFEGLTR